VVIDADGLATIVTALEPLAHTSGEVTADTGLHYRAGDPVCIRVRRRGRHYDLTDDGAAVNRAGRPAGWLAVVDRLVAEDGFNVNRRGVLSVPAVDGRDIAALAARLAECSRRVYLTLLEHAQ
jgi:hypothetical protein